MEAKADLVSSSLPEEKRKSKSQANGRKLGKDDTIGSFLKQMARYPLLKPEEEVQLARSIRYMTEIEELSQGLESELGYAPTAAELAQAAGLSEKQLEARLHDSRMAKRKMIRANLRLVVSIAKRYLNRGVPFLDLIQEGALGLDRATEKFDPEKGYKFSTYAYWWIRQGITRTLANHGRTIRLPIHVVEKLNKLQKAQRNLRQELQRYPTEQELAAAIEVDIEQLRYLQQVRRSSISLNHRIGKDQETELLELLEDSSARSPEAQIGETMMRQDLTTILSEVLTERENDIICLRYGLSTGEVYTLEEVASLLNISRERVRQMQTRAMRKLRRPQVAQRLKNWLR